MGDETGGEALLRAEGLRKAYGKRPVVQGVSLTVRAGEVVGLLGKNGAGKTTTFRMVVGLVKPDAGRVFFQGGDVTDWPMYRRARVGLGYLPQQRSIFRYLTVEKNLLAIAERVIPGRKAQRARVDALIERLNLEHVRTSLAHPLSGGEKRRLEIARGLVPEPRVLLLDEPFAALDPIVVAEIQSIVFELRDDGIGVLITDHSVHATLSTTDRAYIMLDGRILVAGTPDEVVRDPTAQSVYLGEGFHL